MPIPLEVGIHRITDLFEHCRLRIVPVIRFVAMAMARIASAGNFCRMRRAEPASNSMTSHRKVLPMPEQETIERAREDAREGKSPSTQAGEFVREEIHHVREGKHGARNAKQAIAIGLSKARRAGVKLGTPNPKTASARTRKKAAQDSAHGRRRTKTSAKRSRATKSALKREGHSAASSPALGRHAHASASMRGKKSRVAAAKKAAKTRASHGRSRRK